MDLDFTQPLGHTVVVIFTFLAVSVLVIIAVITVLPRMLNAQLGGGREAAHAQVQDSGEEIDDFEITASLHRIERRMGDIEERLERLELRWR